MQIFATQDWKAISGQKNGRTCNLFEANKADCGQHCRGSGLAAALAAAALAAASAFGPEQI